MTLDNIFYMKLLDIDKFPFPEIREQQKEAINKLNKVSGNKKYVFLELGTGVGKSPIAVGICETLGSGYILTTTKQLQDQYSRDFAKRSFTHIKGRGNYLCDFVDGKISCDAAPCISDPDLHKMCMATNSCSYHKLRVKAKNSATMCTNYAFFFRCSDCGEWLDKRDVIVFDECHNIETQLIGFAEIELTPQEFFTYYFSREEYPKYDHFVFEALDLKTDKDIRDYFIRVYNAAVKPKWEEFDKLLKEEISNAAQSGNYDKVRKIKERFNFVDKVYKRLQYLISSDDSNWIFEIKETAKGMKSLYAKPLSAGPVFKDYIEKFADRFVFMSATIIDEKAFAESIGVSMDDVEFIRFESPFDPSRSPIYNCNAVNCSYQSLQDPETARAIVTYVKFILDKHPDDKGIIHTGNQKITKILYDALRTDPKYRIRMLYRYDDIKNDDIIREHNISNRPTVLVSSSMIDGVDLHDDLSRFQIIVKVPYLSLADKRVKIKTERDPGWYRLQTWFRIIQECGRSTRNEEDESVTYILDTSFDRELKIALNAGILPEQFKKRILSNG